MQIANTTKQHIVYSSARSLSTYLCRINTEKRPLGNHPQFFMNNDLNRTGIGAVCSQITGAKQHRVVLNRHQWSVRFRLQRINTIQ